MADYWPRRMINRLMRSRKCPRRGGEIKLPVKILSPFQGWKIFETITQGGVCELTCPGLPSVALSALQSGFAFFSLRLCVFALKKSASICEICGWVFYFPVFNSNFGFNSN